MPSRAVVVMGKAPRPGRVKTRIAARTTETFASDLYRALLADVFELIDRAHASTPFERIFACADLDDEAHRLAPAGWRTIPQQGDGLGARIEHARVDAAAEHVIIVGSDAPTMPVERITQSFDALDAKPCVVLGPTIDGGYYLIALAGAAPTLLDDSMPWSTDRVFMESCLRAKNAGLEVVVLERGFDVDELEDLAQLVNTSGRASTLAREALATWGRDV